MKGKNGRRRPFFQRFVCASVLSVVFMMMMSVFDGDSKLNSWLIQAKADTTSSVSSSTTKNADTFSWDNADVYFLLTDRFNNGDTSNDHSYNRGLDEDGNVINYSDTSATFHGGDFVGITEKIEEGYFDKLGVNALWISAPYEQIHGYVVGSDSSNSFAHYAYHGYYVLDYTQTDANFGTGAEFKQLVDTAHEHGIRVIIDIVMNHSGYNTIYDMAEYNYGTLADGWEDTYYKSTGINNTSYHSLIDYTSSISDWSNWWGSDWVRCGVAGYDAGGSTNLTMSLSGLPDFKTESTSTVGIPKILQTKWKMEGRYNTETAELSSYLTAHNMKMTTTNVLTYWLQSWVREYGIDGFRCDTAKHVDLSSWATLKSACVEALDDWKAANPDKALDDTDFWMTGEVWDHGVYKDDYYTTGGFDSLINFSTQGGGILAKSTVAATYQGFADKINTDPDFNVLSYISSHDSVLTRGDSIYMGSAFLMLPGAVQTFYGDETDRKVDSSASSNGNHDVRSDMNWDDMNTDTLAHWQKVGTFRSNHISVGAGANAALTTTDGVAFSRIYSDTSKDIADRIAACIGCTSNTDVTIDVSSLWADGQILVNAYDYTTATVTGGKVTFNSGKNGTILIEEPDGKPLISVTGNAKFHDTEQVTLKLTDADSAKVSVDGAKKFLAYDGDTFTIGETAYEGDTVSVTVEATNTNGTRTATYTFYKAYADEDISSGGGSTEEHRAVVYVKSSDGTAPYIYAWKDASTKLTGAWPGTKMTEKNSEGYYVMDLGITGKYNIIFNNGAKLQTGDITNLEGGVWIDLTSSSYAYNITQREVEAETTPITFTVKSYTGAAPYLYIWDAAGNTYNGSFPGKALTQKTDDGLYTLTVNSYSSSVSCIVSYGSNTTQSSNITGISSEVLITLTSADCSTYEVTKPSTSDSSYATLKKELRETKNLTAENYTAESYAALYAYVEAGDALIAAGEKNADEYALVAMVKAVQTAQANLVIAKPTVSGLTTGSTSIYGKAAYGGTVKITVGTKVYTAGADDVTGKFSVTVDALKATDTISVICTLGSNSSATYTFKVDSVVIDVTSITLDSSSKTIGVGKTATLTATVLPGNATDPSVTWTTSNSSVATVSSSGVVKGITKGTATITATTSNGLKATSAITVNDIAVTSITLNQSAVTIAIKGTTTLTAAILPNDATDTSVTWTSSDTSVATVSSSGVVTGIAKGTATITATTVNGLKATAAITVNEVAVTSITLSQSAVTIPVSSTSTLTATVLPSNATNSSVTWTSSDTSVATVSGTGVVTGVAKGTATITATTSNGLTASATITVSAVVDSYMFFEKPSSWSSTIYAYIWNDSETYKNAAWPGVAATLNADGTYYIAWPKDYTGTDLNVIFTDKTRQTANLKAVKNGYYTSSGYSFTVTDPTGVALSSSSVSVAAGSTATLTATLSPSTARSTITWTTSDSSIATVSNSGVVTGVAEGTATITAATANGLTASAAITVTKATTSYLFFEKPSSWSSTIYAYIWNDSVTYKNAAWPGVAATLNADGTYYIEWPKDYSGSDLNVIFTDKTRQTANLKAVKNGYYTSSGYSYTVADPTSITLSSATANVEKGSTATLTATVSPATAHSVITWTTSDSSIATVSSAGIVTAVAEGTATITATTANGLTASAAITVTPSTASYLYFEKPASWGSTIYAYIWNDSISFKNAVWPGVVTSVNANGTYYIAWPKDYSGTDLNVIFTDKSHQTADLKAIKNGYYTSSGYSYTVTAK